MHHYIIDIKAPKCYSFQRKSNRKTPVIWLNVTMTVNDMIIVGRNESVDFARYSHTKNVPAKIDTGADSSSVWVSNVRVDKKGILRFNLFGEGSPYYTG